MYRESNNKTRSALKMLSAGFLLCGAAQFACAQEYPNRPVRVIVPFSAGSGLDILGRIMAARLHEQMGQPFIADNRAGAAGRIGHDLAAKAPPDGYTLIVTALGPFIHTPILYPQSSFDPVKDFAPISPFVTGPVVIAVHPSLPVRSVKELIELARKRPGQLNFGSTGMGSVNHLLGEMINQSTGIKIEHVPYKGNAEALTDLIGGQVDMVITAVAPLLPYANAGKVRVIATSGKRRLASMPAVQTLAEAGLPNAQVTIWWGFVAPAATPRAIVDRLNREVVKAMTVPEVREKFAQQGVDPETSTADEFARSIRDDYARWSKVIRTAGIKLE
jgi:tripartite-type tricarboxylate transporter receptor subunit TctC